MWGMRRVGGGSRGDAFVWDASEGEKMKEGII